jgi:hypothetical protein
MFTLASQEVSKPSLAILFGGMVVEEKRRSCNYGGFRRGNEYMQRINGGKRN